MKKTLLILFAITTTLTASTYARENVDNYELKIEGMGCAFCSIAVQKKFRSLDGIDDESIDLETGIFAFTLPVKNKQTKETINQLIDETGYELAYLKVVRADGSIEEFNLKSEDQ